MKWNIIHKNLNKSAIVSDNNYLSIGNNSENDIFLETKSTKNLFYQFFLDNGFIYFEHENKKSVYYLKNKFSFENHNIIIECNSKPNFKTPIEEEISNIFSSSIFKTSLEMIQNEFSNNSDFLFYKEEIDDFVFFKTTCYYLNLNFWDKYHFFDKEDRILFQKYIWCLWAESYQYGVITSVLEDDSISEIMINNSKNIFLEKNGVIISSNLKFDSNENLKGIIERICNQVGRKIDESIPYCDARLPDGSRVHAIIPPLSLDGPCLTIRKFPKKSITFSELIQKNSIENEISSLLKEIVLSKKNILISGGTGTGKTTLLNCLSSFICPKERIITIEDSAELKLQQPHVIRLETRKENIEQKGSICIRELLKNSLRMRPDRIIIGECRGGEALDMLQAMNTGHEGSMTTIHSNSTVDALRRLETLVLFASSHLPSRAIREQISSAIHYIIQLSRNEKGHRYISAIHQMVSLSENNNFITKSIFEKNLT